MDNLYLYGGILVAIVVLYYFLCTGGKKVQRVSIPRTAGAGLAGAGRSSSGGPVRSARKED